MLSFTNIVGNSSSSCASFNYKPVSTVGALLDRPSIGKYMFSLQPISKALTLPAVLSFIP